LVAETRRGAGSAEQNGCISPRLRFLSIRQSAALSVTVLATQSVIFGLAAFHARSSPRRPVVPHVPAGTHVAALVLGVTLLVLVPRLWRGTRTAVALTIAGLAGLAALNAAHGRLADATVEASLALLLGLGRRAFELGCSNRPRPAIARAAVVAWALACAVAVGASLLRHAAGHVIAKVLSHPVPHGVTIAAAGARGIGRGGWYVLVEVLIGGAAAISVLALRSLVAPAPAANRHLEHEDRAARAILDAHGSDSLSPFLLRPDKALMFAAGGVLSYRVIGGTAVVSADPVAPPGAAATVLAGFQDQAHRRGWQVVLWGAGERHLDAYRRLGFRALCVGEEAFVDPRSFSLDGRAVRKLRQSVHRVQRRGWEIAVRDGRGIDAGIENDIEALEARWRQAHPRVHGFAMGMGPFTAQPRADDLYLLARSPRGELGAVMRFVTCGANLSLDTMQRVGETPNGLNEALVVRALEAARERGIAEVSLNYAGLAHLVRREPTTLAARALTGLALAPLHRRFQMDRLVRFNDKFSPEWRPRYLVFESRAALPRTIVRVLQAEGYLTHRRRLELPHASVKVLVRALVARMRARPPISEPR
jgi:lysyl-tRNA synthetase class 2